MSYRQQLHTLTNRILDMDAHAYGDLYTACDELYRLLVSITSIDTGTDPNRKEMQLETGKAIGLTWAAMCIKDIMRTKKFMTGLFNAVNDQLQKQPGRPVHILYAGTGPFATLVLPLIARFNPNQLQCSLLEINEQSCECLQRLIGELDLGYYIQRVEQADATLYRIAAGETVDIFISETMNLGLTREPQVAIFMNVLPQLNAETIIIPGSVRLDAALIDPVKRMDAKMGIMDSTDAIEPLATVFELNRETVLEHSHSFERSKEVYRFPQTTVQVAADKMNRELNILTHVVIYKEWQLQSDESPITTPLPLTIIKNNDPAGFSFFYQTGAEPGIQFHHG